MCVHNNIYLYYAINNHLTIEVITSVLYKISHILLQALKPIVWEITLW